MVTALVRRKLGRAVNRKRVLRVMRQAKLIQLMAIIDCCTREIVGWQLELRCRAEEAIALVERAAAVHGIEPGELVLGSDNGSAFTARRELGSLSSGSGIAAAATAIPSRRPSSRAGSGSSKRGRCG